MTWKAMTVVLAGLLTASFPGAAGAGDCSGVGATTHVVHVQKNGFFPSNLFVCPGDKVYFQNRSGYWAKFNQNTGSNGALPNFYSYWMSNGSTRGPLEVQQGMGMRLENLDLYNVANATYPMIFQNGSAPDQY